MEKNKTPEEIKQKIAKDNGFDSWFELLTNADESYIESCIEEYADLYHKEKLKEELMPCDKCRYDGLQQYPDTCQDCGGKEFSPLQ